MKKMFCREILSLAFTAMLVLQAPAQQKALKIGDVIPEEIWTTPLLMVNSPNKTTTLAKDRDKLILLDFWATWCSACLKGFPKMEDLQKQFGDRLKIIPVTSQDRGTLEKFFASKNGQRFASLQSVVGDQHLKKLFPHVGVPFIVWIKDGKLLNTTDSEQVLSGNITKVLEGQGSTLQTVIQMERTRPLMLDDSFDRQRNVSLINYSIFIKGHIPDIGSGGKLRYTPDKRVKGRQFTNLPLMDLYYAVGSNLFKSMKVRENFSKKRMIVEVKNRADLDGVLLADGTFDTRYIYSYELNVPEDRADSLYRDMLNDLNRYGPFTAAIERRPVKCLVLKRTSGRDKLATKGGEALSTFPRTPSVLRNLPLRVMVNMLNGNSGIDLPVIDETGYTGNVDVKVSGVRSPDQLRKELADYDLELVEAVKELDMMVIRDR